MRINEWLLRQNLNKSDKYSERGGLILQSKVPKEIRKAIREAAKYNAIAKRHETIIEKWFEENGVEENDSFRDIFIDCIQQSHNPEEAIRRFKAMLD